MGERTVELGNRLCLAYAGYLPGAYQKKGITLVEQ
jgi:hypothetical protein